MNTEEFNRIFTVHPRAKAPIRAAEGYSLCDVYGRYSTAKDDAFNYCLGMFVSLRGWGFCITSHTSQFFSVQWRFHHPENGRTMLAVCTGRREPQAYYLD